MTRSRLLRMLPLVALCPGWAAQRYNGTGLVLSANPALGTVVVSEDSIPGYMAAMVMVYHAHGANAVAVLRPGQKIDFTLVVGKSSSYIRDIHIVAYESTERDPGLARRLTILDKALGEGGGAIGKGQTVPDFSLIDQNNRPVSLSQLTGKVAVITFIYTRCPLPDYCFRMSSNFGTLQRRFHDRLGRDLVLLSITFDPERDRPEVLAKYAESWKPDPEGWLFLTGSMTSIKQVCGMFGMNFWPDEGLLTHSLHTVIIDRQRKLLANIEGNQFTARQLGDLVEVGLN